ncbi:hypothetical protein GQ55_5G241300 [Panicum hallii var. hallii]|uniref:Uncharacterized protein n=1 Tax=Panicum hallii var. hallii TaxID=1504633 RepID=A0A2T7DJQ4_9POAL|nr:hypothetical protein GQ55_5G241300 [Panicum hallii var. hallii]
MEDGVLAQEDLNLVRFAVDSLNSNSRTRKLAAVQILHSLLLRQEASNTLHVSEITTSTKAVATLISMLSWTGPEDQDIRFFAAKITAELAAGDLLIVGIPGTIQMVSSLLDSDVKNDLVIKQGILAQKVDTDEQCTDNWQLSHCSASRVDIKGEEGGYQNQTSIQANSAHAAVNSSWSSKIYRFLQHIKDMLSVPKEGKEPWMDEDPFPVQGMIILKKLAHDLDNCAEISRAAGLIPKIVGFINYTTYTTNISEEQQNLIMTTALKLVARLVDVEGEIGIALRRKILEQPFLLCNLVHILEDSNGRPEQWGPAMVITAKLAVDEETRQKIGDFQVIIPKLMQTFLCRDGSSSTYCNHLVRTVAGEALSKLTKENTSYCSAILEEETRYDVTEHLKDMLQEEDEYAYVAASMLGNLCAHSRGTLFHLELSMCLSSTLQVELAKIMDTKGNKQLEALLVLASQIFNLNPELESHSNARRLVQKLVATLNSNQKSHPEYPRMRRAVVEVAISIMESCPRYSSIFREEGMMEALSEVEKALSKVEKYKVFLGNVGEVVEDGLHLRDLIDKAKRLIGSTTQTLATLKPGDHA